MSQQFQHLPENSSHDRLLRALAYELKQPLIRIARQAESGEVTTLGTIQSTAEQTLQLIDSYLLAAQAEYGQLALDLSPINTGSILYDTLYELREQASARGISLVLDNRTHEPVMSHQPALSSILKVFATTLFDLQDSTNAKVLLRSYKTRAGKIGIGLFGSATLTKTDVERALMLQGKAHLSLARAGNTHIPLAIAEGLCRAIGSSLQVKHMGRLSGLVTELPRSEQLSWV
ncbi:MAG: hypothetical protein ACR2FM_02235 [Candidatus Saccharimonadales bacterium]